VGDDKDVIGQPEASTIRLTERDPREPREPSEKHDIDKAGHLARLAIFTIGAGREIHGQARCIYHSFFVLGSSEITNAKLCIWFCCSHDTDNSTQAQLTSG
jgi:hypothetical protein